MKIKREMICLDPRAQSRVEMKLLVVSEYAENMREGAQFPPVIVFYDGTTYWLADGFHRVHAARAIGLDEIEADVRNGTLRDAILYSASANSQHGLQRTAEDKRKTVMQFLQDPEWSQWSDREIGKQCSVAHNLVSRLRLGITGTGTSEKLYVNKHGKKGLMRIPKRRHKAPITTKHCSNCERLEAELKQFKERIGPNTIWLT